MPTHREMKVTLTPVTHYQVTDDRGNHLGEFRISSEWNGMAHLKSDSVPGVSIIVESPQKDIFDDVFHCKPSSDTVRVIRISPSLIVSDAESPVPSVPPAVEPQNDHSPPADRPADRDFGCIAAAQPIDHSHPAASAIVLGSTVSGITADAPGLSVSEGDGGKDSTSGSKEDSIPGEQPFDYHF